MLYRLTLTGKGNRALKKLYNTLSVTGKSTGQIPLLPRQRWSRQVKGTTNNNVNTNSFFEGRSKEDFL